MPSRIQNYSEWDGRPPGYHPPACTCYQCNEGRLRQSDEGHKRQATARLAAAAARSNKHSTATPPVRAPSHRGHTRQAWKVTRRIVTMAICYALALHVITLAALVIYTIFLEETQGVLLMLNNAGEAYVNAWRSAIASIGL